MQTATDILSLSKENKIHLHKYFYEGSYHLRKNLRACKKHELNALLFLSLEKPAELCRFLKTPFFRLEAIINNPVYHHYSIRKKRGGERQIFAPENKLKSIQKRLNYFLQAYYLWIKPEEVHGFVVNPRYLGASCNIVENAKRHTGKKHILNIDLKDFFPSVTAKQVKEIFSSGYFNFNESIATALTLLTTYEGKLPTGAPTSPVISNFVCLKLDKDLKKFCNENNLTFSRYADDLTFSSNLLISSDTVLDIISMIKKNNFLINEKKLRLKSSGRKQTVTGLTVNEKVNVDRKLLKKIRAMLHDMTTVGIDTATFRHFHLNGKVEPGHREKFINRLKGYIHFVGQVRGKDDPFYIRQKSLFDGVFK